MRKLTIVIIGILMLVLASTPLLLAQDSVQNFMADETVFLPIVRNASPGTIPQQ